ncbi:hypothetical protein [Marinomonas sp.]|uniref:hypothetical protein n=1 Tax=Marinomonas sp. TaxID=1904862 RepID=UPI003BA9BB21
MNIKSYFKNIKTLHFGYTCAAVVLQSVAIYLLFHQEYQRFLFYSFFALVNLGLAIYFRPVKQDPYHQILTEDGEIDKTVFTLDFDSSKQIIKILNTLRWNTTLDRMEKKFLNLHQNIALAFVPSNASKAEIEDASVYDTSHTFFTAAIKFEDARNTAVKLFKQIIEYNKRHGEFATLYADYDTLEIPYGLILGQYLVKHSKQYCHLYGQFIKTLDMDHEVYEADVIFDGFERYGCCPETLELLAIRCLSASGQHGVEELELYVDNFSVNDYLTNKTHYQSFLAQLKQELLCMSAKEQSNVPEDQRTDCLINPDIVEFCQTILEQSIIDENPDTPIACIFNELYDWAQENQ